MNVVEVANVTKTFGGSTVVDSLSFSCRAGEILGMVGPNGAGKTTTIRMLMNIIKPDSGLISILGAPPSEAVKDRLGYLPEERGLYKKQTVLDSIVYLASLKGMGRRSATEAAGRLLEKTGMFQHRHKKIDALSKGMGQIIQFIVTVVHDPVLLVLDEPFSGLDPINTEMLKDLIIELKNQGKTIILSTHQMNQVEEMCDRVLMIDHGRAVLYGDLGRIKANYRGNSVFIACEVEPGRIDGVIEKRAHKDYAEYVLDGKTTPDQLLARLVKAGTAVSRFEIATPSLNEIFIQVAGKRHE